MTCRRAFLQQSAGALGVTSIAALLSGCAGLAARSVPVVEGRVHLVLAHHPELLGPNGMLKILPKGQATPIYVLAMESEKFIALSPICSHLGCTVEVQGSRIVCPCHGSTYDRGGRVLEGPAERALTSFPVALSTDGILMIELRARA